MGTMYYLNPLSIVINKEKFSTLWKMPFESFVVLSTLFLTRKLRQKYLSKYSIKTIFLILRPISILMDDETYYCFPIDTKSREKSAFQIRTVNLTQIESLVSAPLDALEDSEILNLTIDTKEIIFPKIISEIDLPGILYNYPLIKVVSETLDIPVLDVYLTYTDLIKAYEIWKETKDYYINSFLALSSSACILHWFEKNLQANESGCRSISLKDFSNCILKDLEKHITNTIEAKGKSNREIEYSRILEDIYSTIVNMIPEKVIFPLKENVLTQALEKMKKSGEKSELLDKITKVYDMLSYTQEILLEDLLELFKELNIRKIKDLLDDNINQILIPFAIFVVKSKKGTQWYIVSPLGISKTKEGSPAFFELVENQVFDWFKKELSYELDENIIEDYSQYNILDNYEVLSGLFRVLYSNELRLFLESEKEFEKLKNTFVNFGKEII